MSVCLAGGGGGEYGSDNCGGGREPYDNVSYRTKQGNLAGTHSKGIKCIL